MKDKEILYPEHKHPHGVENTPPSEYRIWVCEECRHTFTDNEVRKDIEANDKLWGHPCQKNGIRCESHLEPYIPEITGQNEKNIST